MGPPNSPYAERGPRPRPRPRRTDISGSGSGLQIASSLIRAVKNVKIHRSKCEHLSRQCLDLASALRDHSDKLEGTGAQQAVEEVERVLARILDRVRKWENLGKMKSFVKQKEISIGLEESYQELHACSMRFNIALHLDESSRSRELEEIRKRDHDELLEMITRTLQDKSLLKMELATGTPEDAHNVVEAIEQELKEADVGETQERQLQEDFGELRGWVEKLPPRVDLTGSIQSSSGGLLEAATQDTEPLLRRSPDGTVEAGTLEGLVDRLIEDTHDRAKDNEFRRVFLATYPLFTTGEDLFRRLKRRIEEVGDVQTAILSGSSRYSALLVLRKWLQGESENWTQSRELLSIIRDFARSVGGSDSMKDAAQGISNLANEKMNVAVVSPISPPRPQPLRETTSPSSLEHYKPEDIAKSLSVIEGEFYSEITQADYIAHLRGTPITTHIASAASINNRLANWVKGKILSSEDVNRRATNFKHFVLVAEECRKSQNFSSMSAIVAALQSIPQLILTREIKLTNSERQLLPQMDEILVPQADHQAYREVLQNINSPFAIPWLAVHLRTLQTLYDRHGSTVVVDQRPLINFTRCTKILERIDDIRQDRPGPSPSPQSALSTPPPPPPPADRLPGKANVKDEDKDRRHSSGMAPAPTLSLTWVKKELDETPSAISREQFETRVAALADIERYIERQMYQSHGLELHPARDSGDQTALHEASEHGDLAILRSLLSRGANPNAQNEGKVTPLILASGKGRLEAARLLCDHGANVNHQDSLGRTSLHVAAENGHYGIGNLLLDCGANVDAPENNLWTPLHLAADKGKISVAQLLLERSAEVDSRDKMDWTALHFASQQGHLELVWLLLEHGADALARNQEGHNFLDVAWASGHKETVDVNARYGDGLTALHIASQYGDPELMRWLVIDYNVSPSAEDEDQETPLFIASRNGKLEAARLLLDAGADPNHRDAQGMTPLHVASENGHEFVAKLLLEKNADVTAKYVYDWTPLHFASRTGESKVAELLLDHHAEANAMNDSNWTPLHMASQKGHLNVVEVLLARHADVSAQEADGETALHLAVFYGHRMVVQVLLNNGADPRIKNKEGETPFDVASSRESKDIARLLDLTVLVGERGGELIAEQQRGDRPSSGHGF